MLDVKKLQLQSTDANFEIQTNLPYEDDEKQWDMFYAEGTKENNWRLAVRFNPGNTDVSCVAHLRPQIGTKVSLHRIEVIFPGRTAYQMKQYVLDLENTIKTNPNIRNLTVISKEEDKM